MSFPEEGATRDDRVGATRDERIDPNLSRRPPEGSSRNEHLSGPNPSRRLPAGSSGNEHLSGATKDERKVGATKDERGGATRDDRSSTRLARLRTILPDELLAEYEPIRNLNVNAGQADLVVCRRRSAPQDPELVVKLYRQASQLDQEILDRVRSADPAHVVKLFDFGQSDGEHWEVQEFCTAGTLTDLRLEHGGQLTDELARDVLLELTSAIEHIHSLGITHRDLKPENVLVRTTEPLDLVLTDFGVAAEQIATVQLQTIAASWAWAAPEVHTKGQVSRSIDWWALGAIMYQMLTARHLVAGPDGRLPADDKLIRATIVDGLYTSDAVTDPRWRALVDGLLSYNADQRWGSPEVESWLAGQNPPAVRTVPRRDLGRAETRALTYIFRGTPVRTSAELLAVIEQDWDAAADLLAGRIPPDLEAWLKARPDGDRIVSALAMETSGGARLIRLQSELAPGAPLIFRGKAITLEQLTEQLAQARPWAGEAEGPAADAHRWVDGLVRGRVLRAVAACIDGPDAARFARADELVNGWLEQSQQVAKDLPQDGLKATARIAFQRNLPVLVSAALEPDSALQLPEAVKQLAGNDAPGRPVWATNLAARVSAAPTDALGLFVVALAILPDIDAKAAADLAAKEAAREAAAAQLAAEAAQQRKQLAVRQRRESMRRRRARVPGQLMTRGFLSVIYSLPASFVFSGSWSSSAVWTVLSACLIGVAISIVVDAILDDPKGPFRIIGTSVGIVLSVAVLLNSLASQAHDPADARMLAWGICGGWVAGSVVQFVATKLSPGTEVPKPVKAAKSWSALPVGLAALSGATAWVLGRCTADPQCTDVSGQLLSRAARVVDLVHLDPLGIGSSALVLAVIAGISLLLFAAAPFVGRRHNTAGVIVAIFGGLAGLAVFLAYPANPVTMVAGLIWGAVA